MTIESKKQSSKSYENDDVDALKARIAELEKTQKADKRPVLKEIKIPQDEYIRVMSLLPYNLNLSTQEGGQGDVKRFTKFGEIKNILYGDLVKIIEVNRSFMESGYFYILNPDVIRKQGLDEIYSKILTKEKIEEIIFTNSEDCVPLYESATPPQQEIIVRLLIDKIRTAPDSINLNIVDKISRISGIDIAKKAEEEKAMVRLVEEPEKE